MKKILLTSLLIAVMAVSFSGLSFACHGGSCPLKKGGCGKYSEGKSECPIAAKLMGKAHLYLENQKELGLKEDQIKTIKAIKMEAKKTAIRQKAEMQVFHIDLKTKLSEPEVDVEGLNGMIDEMAKGMTSGAKAAVASYAKLKAVLTDEQQNKLKEIWLRHEAAEHAH